MAGIRPSGSPGSADDNQPAVTVRVFQGEREMAADNKLLGQFNLVDIPPAPRGQPQIEVSFDIDANGILQVSAKDLGSGKEQSIRITASSGLTEDEVKRMVQDAEIHAEEDRRKKERIEARNQLDSLVYSVEHSLGEHASSLDAPTKGSIESALEEAKKALDTEDLDTLKRATDTLTQASHKLAEAMYNQTAKARAGDGQTGAESGQASQSAGDTDKVVDADFEEIR
jgi:molecular chaperone DnaK